MTDAPTMTQSNAAVPGTSKADPETMALRAKPMRAIRFKRGAVVGIAALGSVGLMATVWVALKPGSLLSVSPVEDRNVLAKPSTDALAGLPKSYGDVPKLGPPLPGDLGRPILAHQRAMATENPNTSSVDSTADQAAIMERDRLAAERTAARQSGLLVRSSGSATSIIDAPPLLSPSAPTERSAATAAVDQDRDPNGQQRKIAFIRATDDDDGVNPHRLVPAASPYMLSAGSIIAASLITGLRSDIPGLVIAQVTERVFDTATGQHELIPQGARLIGSYDSVVAFGQRRALVVWQRIIMPDGRSVAIDNVPATDASGYAGLADKVDMHTWTLLKGVAVSTLLGVGSNLTFSNESDLVQALRQSTQQSTARAGDQLTSRNLQIQPTITVRPGASVRLVVHRDLVLAPAQK